MTQNAPHSTATAEQPRLLVRFRQEIVPELMRRLGRDNPLAVPRLSKIVLNIGVGRAKNDEKLLSEAITVLSAVTGQKPIVTAARRSIAGFGLRAGMPIGCKVTVRRKRMYELLDRLISIVLPRIRDFRGLSTDAFDGHGNYTLGIREHYVFPEVDPDAVSNVFGMNITICTTAETDPEALELLTLLGMPFRQ